MKRLLIVCLSLQGALARAQDPNTLKQAAGVTSLLGNAGGDLTFEMLDGDSFVTLNAGLNFDLGQIGFGIQVPLRLKVVDADPQTDEIGGVLRQEDWDEWTDYLKILRYFRYGRKGELVFFQVGDLPGATLGHGTIVNRYYNNVDLNHYRMGIQADLNTAYGGVETLFNNGFVTNLIGLRGYLKPWALVDPESYLNNLAIGFSVVSDYSAPYCLLNKNNNCIPDNPPAGDDSVKQVDSAGNLQVAVEKAATVIGGDVEFRALNTDLLSITPYLDLNGIVDAGVGFHIGIQSVFHLPVVSLDIQARLEYRRFSGDYVPAYFDSFYEIQKFGYPFKDERGVFGAPGKEVTDRPKRRVTEELSDIGLNGYYAELVFDLLGLVQLGANYDDYDGPYNSNLRVYLAVPALEVVKFGAYYYRHNYEGAGDAFTFDDKSLFLAEARYMVYSSVYLIGQYWRVWQLDRDPISPSYGDYVAVDDWSLGLGLSFAF